MNKNRKLTPSSSISIQKGSVPLLSVVFILALLVQSHGTTSSIQQHSAALSPWKIRKLISIERTIQIIALQKDALVPSTVYFPQTTFDHFIDKSIYDALGQGLFDQGYLGRP